MKVQCDFIDVKSSDLRFFNKIDRIFERKISRFHDDKSAYIFTNKPGSILSETELLNQFIYNYEYVNNKILNLKKLSEVNEKKYVNSPINILNEIPSLNDAHQDKPLSQCVYDSLRLLTDRLLVFIDDEIEFNVYTSKNNMEELSRELDASQISSNVKIHLFDDNSQTFSSSITIHGQALSTLPLNMSSYKETPLSPIALHSKLEALTSAERDAFQLLSRGLYPIKPLMNKSLTLSGESELIISNENTNNKRKNTSTAPDEQSLKYSRHFLLDNILDVSNSDPIRALTGLNQSSFFSNEPSEPSERSSSNITAIIANKDTTREEKKELLTQFFNNPAFKRKSVADKHECLNQAVAFFIEQARWLYSEYQLKVVNSTKKNTIESEALLLLIRDNSDKNLFTYKCLDLNNCEKTGAIRINAKKPTLNEVLTAMYQAGCNITDEARLNKMDFCVSAANEYAQLLTNDNGVLSDDNNYYLLEFNNNSSTSPRK